MEKMIELYEEKKKVLEEKHTKDGRITLLGKWEIAKLHMMYFPDKDIQVSDYDSERQEKTSN